MPTAQPMPANVPTPPISHPQIPPPLSTPVVSVPLSSPPTVQQPSTPAASQRYQPTGRSHRVSISANYVELLKDLQAQSVGNQEDADNEVRLEKENAHNIHVAWWHQVRISPPPVGF